MPGYTIDLITDWTDIDPQTRGNEADWAWASTEQLDRFRMAQSAASRCSLSHSSIRALPARI